MARAYIGLGSNEGDRAENLRGGFREISIADDVLLAGKSGIYESEPVGVTDQPEFLNAVVAVETTLGPYELLALLFDIEQRFGRKRLLRWGPRTLDLDILLMGEIVQDDPKLILPHPRLRERRFVLEPLLEVAPALIMPDGTAARALLDALGDDQAVWRVDDL